MGLRNVKITREAASADQKAGDEFPDGIKKVTEEKGCLPDRFLMQMKVSYSGKKMLQKIFVSKEKKQVPGFKAGRARLTDFVQMQLDV